MPRKSCCDPALMLNALKHFFIFNEDGSLKGRHENVWTEAARFTKTGLTPSTLNFYVRQNKFNLQTDMRNYLKVPEREISVIESTISNDSGLDTTYNINSSFGKTSSNQKIYDYIELSEKEWDSIKPVVETSTSSINYHKLQTGWTDLLSVKIYNRFKLPCAFAFKRGRVYTSGDFPYLKVTGKCRECDASVIGHCFNEPESNNGISINLIIEDTRGKPHVKRRFLKGARRVQVGQELLMKKTAVWYNDVANNMKFGDPVPPYLPKKATLRKCKEQAGNKELRIEPDIDVISSLRYMKYDGQYGACIKKIMVDKFACIYVSPLQIHLYKYPHRYRKIEIDATGGIAQSIGNPNNDRYPCFLYQIVMAGDTGIAPIAQMLSEQHDTNAISYWLRELLKDLPAPDEAVSDYSLALLNATSLSFNNRPLKLYISDCFLFLQGQELQHPLNTFLRVDIAHLMNILCKKKIFDKKNPAVKDFYARSLGLLTTSSTLKSFRKMLKSILIIALSECDGQDTEGQDLESEIREKKIFRKMETFDLKVEENTLESHSLNLTDSEELEETEHISEFIENIKEQAQEKANQCRGFRRANPYFSPEVANVFMRFGKQFPLWTNVMLQYFSKANDVASSASIESYFKEVKASLGHSYKPLRPDKFIAKHIRWIENSCKLERAIVKNKNISKGEKNMVNQEHVENDPRKKKSKKVKRYEENDDDHLMLEERWKGKNPPCKQNNSDENSQLSAHLSFDDQTDSTMLEYNSKQMPSTSSDHNKPMNSFSSIHLTDDVEVDVIDLKENIEPFEVEEIGCNPVKEICSHNKQEQNIIFDRDTNCSPNGILHEQNINKQRGKYLRACPDIQLMHSRSLKRHPNAFLRNASSLNTVEKIQSQYINVKHTCPFDALVEILTNAYIDNSTYREQLDGTSDIFPFHGFINRYTTKGVSASLYSERAQILSTHFTISGNVLNCADNVNALIKRIYKDSEACITFNISETCTNCKHTNNNIALLEIQPKLIWTAKDFATGLQNAIDGHFNQIYHCTQCNTLSTIKIPGIHLILESELTFMANINRKYYPKAKNTIYLETIPTVINIGNDRYICNGIIHYESSSAEPCSIGHYKAYSRRVTGNWKEYNDMCKKPLPVANSKTKKVTPSTFIYTKISSNS